MKVTQETSLWSLVHNEKFWAEGQTNAEIYTPNELDELEELLESFKDEWDIVELNDEFRFENEVLATYVMTAEEFAKRMNWDYDDLNKELWDLPF